MTDEEILRMDSVPIAVAAVYLGKSEQFIRCGIQQGVLPFGSAVRRGRYSYIISPGRLVEIRRCATGLNWGTSERAEELEMPDNETT